ncbi:MAG: Ig-like domain-containing protein [Bacteroidetes bacterium]|jgi:hypothetical protein|nr:Ig-like domain-containing protein [Bacteroidota bacterium]
MKQFLWCLLLAAGLWPAVATAQVIGLSLPDTTVALGSDLWLPVRADSSVTGLNVTSLQLQFNYNRNLVEPDSVILTGTLLDGQGWTVTMHRPSVGVIRIAAAGTTPLAGSGPILRIRIKLLTTGWSDFQFSGTAANLLNEGQPAVTLRNCWIQTIQPPSMDVWPDDGVLGVGEQMQFSTGSGAAPYTWSTSDPAIATIDANGLLTAVSRGSVQVSVHDTAGKQGQTDRWVVVRAIGISLPDTSVPATHTIDVPVRVTSLTPWTVTAGTVRVNFNADVLTPVGVITDGTLLEGHSPAVNLSTAGAVRLSFASDQPVLGQGALFIIRFQTRSTTGWSNLDVAEGLFNEDLPAKFDHGSISVTSLATISLGTSGDRLLAEDTLEFNVWGGVAPFTWTSSDPLVAHMMADGRLVGLRSGRVRVTVRDAQGATGISNEIRVFDGAVKFEDRLAASPGWVDVPVRLARLASGRQWSSYQLKLSYNADMLAFESVTTAGTATASWSTTHHVSGSSITVAGATAGSLTGTGTLCIVRFAVLPSIPLNWEAALNVDHVLLNEGLPDVDRWNGRVRIAGPPGRVSLWSPGDGWTQRPLDQPLSWSTVEFAERYELQIAEDALFTAPVMWDSTLTSNTVISGALENGKLYFWRVRARNSLGIGLWSDDWSFRTVVSLPLPPVLAAPANGSSDMPATPTLAWHPSAQATSYDLQVSEDSTFATDVRLVGNITDTTNQLSMLDHSRRFFWRVRAVNEAGWSAWSGAWSFRTIVAPADAPFLSQPSNGLTMVSIAATFRWNAVSVAAAYQLQLAGDAGFTQIVADSAGITDTTLTIAGLEHAHMYYWRVRGVNASGDGAWSDVWSFETIMGTPGVTVLAYPANGAIGTSLMPLLQWHRALAAQAYDIQVSDDPGFSSPIVNATMIPDTSYPIGPLQPLRLYYWRVRAMNVAETSAYSEVWQFTTTTTDAVVGDRGIVPDRFGLEPNYPNPFNPSTQITFLLKESSPVTLTIYTIAGAEVERIIDADLPAGTYETWWNAAHMPSGTYLCRMTAGRFTAVQRLVLIK